ncbi:hypothetical protein AZE42_13757 [Rhizopogon vesiculosus]|uniref:Uncharacterized protein n=1 Tax=Rhizopogon vesiculosus TaxID=180088 RepID=A0A1J8QL85_9AGAM|nr:hypothetical protein AZE42_13757 [Rhizopogon vesiculosus]
MLPPPKCAFPASHHFHTTQKYPAASTSLSPCPCHSNAPSFGVIRAFYHARTPGPKYAFLPPPIILLTSAPTTQACP